MRAFNFKARNVGTEKYLTYTMGEECELDEDVLDYCEENELNELVKVIYEEDDDYDYLTYDITGKVSLADFSANPVKGAQVLTITKNIAANLISLKEQAVHLAYILLNKNFVYVDQEDYSIKFICLPIESEATVAVEFKGFVRQLLANLCYDVDEDVSYVGKLLTYINGDTFNLRGLLGLSEALMDEAGIEYEAADGIDADGVEVVSSEEPVQAQEKESVSDFMKGDADDVPLPEIGDDEEETPAEAPAKAPEAPAEAPASEAKKEPEKVQTKFSRPADDNAIASRIRQIVEESDLETNSIPLTKPTPIGKKNVIKVNRAAIIQNVAAEQEIIAAEQADHEEQTTQVAPEAAAVTEENEEAATEAAVGESGKLKSNSILSQTIQEPPKVSTLLNVPKAMPYLIRVNTKERIMLNKPTFKLGKASRGVDYTIDGNGAISRIHAIITQKDDVCYIKDNKSTNHTYVNNVALEDGAEEILTHDSLVRLGDEDFVFKIR